RQAASDRWRLAAHHVRNLREAWNQATVSGATDVAAPVDLLTAAERTIADSEPAYRAGDVETTLRLSRRADAWALRSSWQLTDALLNSRRLSSMPQIVSSPPIETGHPKLQVAWSPLMGDEGWSDNLLASGGLDRAETVTAAGWTLGRRKMARAECDMSWVSRGYFDGAGAVKLWSSSTIDQPLDGGYEGTVMAFSAPSVTIKPGQAIRIDAMIRTIGFGQPHQGVLVHDSIGGQAMGKLVRGATDWTRVRLFRQSTTESEVQVRFEFLGDGEAVIDEVEVKVWDPKPLPRLPFRTGVTTMRDIR
ncbi:MAG: hypothetical protein AAFU85_03045, partial [Planctomycetota bacterium]